MGTARGGGGGGLLPGGCLETRYAGGLCRVRWLALWACFLGLGCNCASALGCGFSVWLLGTRTAAPALARSLWSLQHTCARVWTAAFMHSAVQVHLRL